jgi:hypothetical protein
VTSGISRSADAQSFGGAHRVRFAYMYSYGVMSTLSPSEVLIR